MKIEISKLTNQDKVDRKMPKVKFSNFSNMKIAITPEQPLDEVVRELERLGYSSTGFQNVINPTKSIRTVRHEKYQNIKKFEFLAWHINAIDELWKLTTLAELKEMK